MFRRKTKIMPRHDFTWNETAETALSNPEPNTSNSRAMDSQLPKRSLRDTDDWDPYSLTNRSQVRNLWK